MVQEMEGQLVVNEQGWTKEPINVLGIPAPVHLTCHRRRPIAFETLEWHMRQHNTQ